jgi:hypothetical protein
LKFIPDFIIQKRITIGAMALIDFGVVREELGRAGCMHTAQVLVRESKYVGSGNTPEVLILTDKCLYHGGTDLTGRRFYRIRFGDVYFVEESGRLFWRSIHVRYRDGGRKRSLFICPFTGELHAPVIDEDSFNRLLGLFNLYLKND